MQTRRAISFPFSCEATSPNVRTLYGRGFWEWRKSWFQSSLEPPIDRNPQQDGRDTLQIGALPPQHLHSVRLGREAKLVVLYLEPAWTRDVTNDVTMHATLVPLAGYIVRDPLIGELSVALREECRNTTTASHQHTVALGAILGARLLRAQFPSSRPERRRLRGLPTESLERVKRFIAEHLHEKLPLESLAREARYSPAHFSRLFKRSTGFTTEQYLLRTRLLRAKEFLRMGEFTISEVAYRLGFSDHSHFTTQFKRLFGAPPKVYLALGGEH